MKNILISTAVALVAMTSLAMADKAASDKHGILEPVPVPNGVEVRGCTYIGTDGKHVCDPKSIQQALKDGANPSVSYLGVFTGSGSGND